MEMIYTKMLSSKRSRVSTVLDRWILSGRGYIKSSTTHTRVVLETHGGNTFCLGQLKSRIMTGVTIPLIFMKRGDVWIPRCQHSALMTASSLLWRNWRDGGFLNWLNLLPRPKDSLRCACIELERKCENGWAACIEEHQNAHATKEQ